MRTFIICKDVQKGLDWAYEHNLNPFETWVDAPEDFERKRGNMPGDKIISLSDKDFS